MPETLRNATASLSVDLYGGAITDFHLLKEKVNPLQFSFTSEQMPENNKKGAPYKGHFLCLGRWGEPSKGEIKAGVPNHGHFANIRWEKGNIDKGLDLEMTAKSEIEGLAVKRKIKMNAINPIYSVEETVSNINPIGRLYNIVQHPTFSYPFLDDQTIVDCNGDKGFNQKFYRSPERYGTQWPLGRIDSLSTINLRNPKDPCNSIFSYVIKPNEKLGWLTCFSPRYKTLIGYVWKREDFPWIHFWLHWKDRTLQYRGLEFGTAGLHKPFKEILKIPTIFKEKTLVYIDAREEVKYCYSSFIFQVEDGFDGVGKVELKNNRISIQSRDGDEIIGFTDTENFLM